MIECGRLAWWKTCVVIVGVAKMKRSQTIVCHTTTELMNPEMVNVYTPKAVLMNKNDTNRNPSHHFTLNLSSDKRTRSACIVLVVQMRACD